MIDELDLTAEESLLDCGAGVGGPAAWAAQAVGVTPLRVEPEDDGAAGRHRPCAASQVQAVGSALAAG